MNRLSCFPITTKWPARHRDRLQLVGRAFAAFVARPAVARGLPIPAAPPAPAAAPR
jgi:hypothetical protein